MSNSDSITAINNPGEFSNICADQYDATYMHNFDTGKLMFCDLANLSHLHTLEAESKYNSESSTVPGCKMSNPYFYPLLSHTRSLDAFQEWVEADLLHLYTASQSARSGNNLKCHERNALQELSKLSEIVIRQADKGGAIVILDSLIYKQENLKILSNRTTYRPLQYDPTLEFHTVLSNLAEKGFKMGILNRREVDFVPS